MNKLRQSISRLLRRIKRDELDEQVEKTAWLLANKEYFPIQYILRDLRIGNLRAEKIADSLESLGLVTFKENAPSILVVNQSKVKEFLQKHGIKSTAHFKMKRIFLNRVKSEFQLDINYLHGISHWERVEKIGLHLSKETKADTVVVSLFSYLHDSKRIDEEADSEHGARAALFAQQLYEEGLLDITADQLDSLVAACKFHSQSVTKPENITIATCLDADRIDLLRLGIMPEEELLYTPAGKEFVASSELENLYKKLTSSAF